MNLRFENTDKVFPSIDYNGGTVWVTETDVVMPKVFIAQTPDLQLEGVPVVEVEDGKIVRALKSAISYLKLFPLEWNEGEHILHIELVQALKAAQSKGCYTEEHIRAAIHFGQNCTKVVDDLTYRQRAHEVIDFLTSIQPEIVVETEKYRHNSCINKCASYPSECLCDMEGVKPITFQRNGRTYYKIKQQ